MIVTCRSMKNTLTTCVFIGSLDRKTSFKPPKPLFMVIIFCYVICWEEIASVIFVIPLQVAVGCYQDLCQTKKVYLPQPLYTGLVIQVPKDLNNLLMDPVQFVKFCLDLEGLKTDLVFEVQLHQQGADIHNVAQYVICLIHSKRALLAHIQSCIPCNSKVPAGLAVPQWVPSLHQGTVFFHPTTKLCSSLC